ncbi:hypothetical protein EAX61_12245 [Dokdonia sinensis]|uniref:Uncharacterized protein n=1 Tax=Dokdonia sinensis TaxID=2479847 RepID=A0A3M0FWU6_9FLAO|nr:hypothetical protein [Dokdonia sinensis]RMB57134.1 hypothetical protein EAX61_12245 [Dokdonia sinensis]
MATTIFEDKLSEYIGIAQKASHGLYISNGVYHQNLENVEINYFIEAVLTAQKMFDVALDNQSKLITIEGSKMEQKAFWNGLKRQKDRFDGITKVELDLKSNKNNVAEIIAEYKNNNQQVIVQLGKAIAYNLVDLPVVFFAIVGDTKKQADFRALALELKRVCLASPEDIDVEKLLAAQRNIASEEEILSWFTLKANQTLKQKAQAELARNEEKNRIASEKQRAIDEANDQVRQAEIEAKKAQKDALRLMEEMKKKYGL